MALATSLLVLVLDVELVVWALSEESAFLNRGDRGGVRGVVVVLFPLVLLLLSSSSLEAYATLSVLP